MWWLVTILALTEPAESRAPAPALRLATAATAERIKLSPFGSAIRVEVVPLDQVIRLHTAGNVAQLGARIGAAAGQICSDIHVEKSYVELRCKTPQLDAVLTKEGRDTFLDINELRGLPWRLGIDGPPVTYFDPQVLNMGDGWAGERAVVRAEQALHEGRFLEAANLFRSALNSHALLLAQVRLGDLALIAGDPQTALGWYELGSRVGVYGRLSAARLCEFDPECIVYMPSLDPDPYSLPGPLRDDLVLRSARALSFAGMFVRSVETMRRRFESVDDEKFCQLPTGVLCRRLVLTALRHVTVDEARKVMEVYMLLPDRTKGPVAVDLAREGAEVAAKLSAPAFGANLLSAVSGEVPDVALSDHLVRAAELYLMANDPVRARVIYDFADARGLRKQMGSARWQAVRKLMRRGEPPKPKVNEEDKPPPLADSAAETLATALGLSARINSFLSGKDESAPAKPATADAKTKGPLAGENKGD
ncbi:MAG: hypothetical protein SF187_17910 [Deltaproteobacteria bacterium]|nr:hypothetical protein [Deltaproteobacteria bacterium]